jgi:hypothetical protein
VGSTDADDLQQDVLMIVVRRLGSLEELRKEAALRQTVRIGGQGWARTSPAHISFVESPNLTTRE